MSSRQKFDLIGCCDVKATNYNAEATTCCSDCCTYPSGGPTNGNTSSTALYPSVSKPTTPGDWKQYKVIYQNQGSCTTGGIKYITSTAQNGLVWAKPGSNAGYLHVHLPKGCAMVVAADRLALQNGVTVNGGNGTNGTEGLQLGGINLGKYGVYIIIGIIVLGYLWYTGKLKKLMPKR